MSSRPQVHEFSGAGGITLVGDEWNRGAAAADEPTILMCTAAAKTGFRGRTPARSSATRDITSSRWTAGGMVTATARPARTTPWKRWPPTCCRSWTRSAGPVVVIGASMGGLTGILVADAAGPERVTGLVLVDVVPRYEKTGSARIRDFMLTNLHGFGSLEEAADAVAAYLPYREKPRSPEGLRKNLRRRDGRWFWHWDPAFMTAPG